MENNGGKKTETDDWCLGLDFRHPAASRCFTGHAPVLFFLVPILYGHVQLADEQYKAGILRLILFYKILFILLSTSDDKFNFLMYVLCSVPLEN